MISTQRGSRLRTLLDRGRWFFPFLALFLATASGNFGGDALSVYLSARSLASTGRYGFTGSAVALPGVPEASGGNPAQAPVGRDGLRYSKYGLLVPLLVAPLHALGRAAGSLVSARVAPYAAMACAACLFPLLGALFAELLGRTLRRRGLAGARLDLVVAGAMLSTMLWSYSVSAGTDLVLSLCLFLPCAVLPPRGEGAGEGRLLVAGAALAGAVLAKVYGFCFLPAAVLLLRRPIRRREILCLLGPGLMAVALYGLANQARFGHVLSTGYDGGEQLVFGPALSHALLLLFAPGKGLFVYAPALLLLPAVLPGPWRRGERSAPYLLGLLATSLLLFAPLEYWSGDICWGPRYLLPLVAPAFLVLGSGLVGAPERLRVLFLLLVVLGVIVQIPSVWLNVDRYVQALVGPDRQAPGTWTVPSLSPVIGNWRILVGAPLPGARFRPEGFGRREFWIDRVHRLRDLPPAVVAAARVVWGFLAVAALLLFARLVVEGFACEGLRSPDEASATAPPT